MKSVLKITEKQKDIYKSYLEEVADEVIKLMNEVDNAWSGEGYRGYKIARTADGAYEFDIEDDFAGHMKEFDHDCRASSGEDGCGFCYFLQELGLLPDDRDYDPNTDPFPLD